MKIQVIIIGSTGSVGKQALDVIASNKEIFEIYGLACFSNIETLLSQIREFHPKVVAVGEREVGERLKKMPLSLKVFCGEKAVQQLAADTKAQTVVVSMSGENAYKPLMQAIKTDKKIILVNKEAIVCYGKEIAKAMEKSGAEIIPADSEHCAIFQCLLEGEARSPRRSRGDRAQTIVQKKHKICNIDTSNIEKIILPCSGGPFFGKKRRHLQNVTKETALNHPTWNMGEKISIDSAALINKGLEIIEAHYLFGIPYEKIEILVHPESIVHGMVHWKDGTASALLHAPDMKIPLAFALNYPKKNTDATIITGKTNEIQTELKRRGLTFHHVDHTTFPAITQAYEAGRLGGEALQIYCRTYEKAVKEFLKEKKTFTELLDLPLLFS